METGNRYFRAAPKQEQGLTDILGMHAYWLTYPLENLNNSRFPDFRQKYAC